MALASCTLLATAAPSALADVVVVGSAVTLSLGLAVALAWATLVSLLAALPVRKEALAGGGQGRARKAP